MHDPSYGVENAICTLSFFVVKSTTRSIREVCQWHSDEKASAVPDLEIHLTVVVSRLPNSHGDRCVRPASVGIAHAIHRSRLRQRRWPICTCADAGLANRVYRVRVGLSSMAAQLLRLP